MVLHSSRMKIIKTIGQSEKYMELKNEINNNNIQNLHLTIKNYIEMLIEVVDEHKKYGNKTILLECYYLILEIFSFEFLYYILGGEKEKFYYEVIDKVNELRAILDI